MSNTNPTPNIPNTNSAGSAASGKRELDSHYLLAKAEYDACIASVGIQPGWRVLDAGCGTGTFLPHIAQLVGPTGSIDALDHAQDSIDIVRGWIASERPAAPIETHVGPLNKLPYPDASFDCVWCANTIQYLMTSEVDSFLAESLRVLKPGGLLAIKEMDSYFLGLHPINPLLRWHLILAALETSDWFVLTKGTAALGACMRAHGMHIIKSDSTWVERTAPLDQAAKPYLANIFRTWAIASRKYEQVASDYEAWDAIVANIEDILASPDARYREVFMLFVGQKPA